MTTTAAPGREPLLDAITTFLAHHHVPALDDTRASLAQTIDRAGAEEVAGLCGRLAAAGADWSYYPPTRWRGASTICSRIACSKSRRSCAGASISMQWPERSWNPVRLVATGRPIDAGVLRAHAHSSRRVMADCIGLAVAQLLPEQYRGVYTLDNPDLGSAPAVLREVGSYCTNRPVRARSNTYEAARTVRTPRCPKDWSP